MWIVLEKELKKIHVSKTEQGSHIKNPTLAILLSLSTTSVNLSF